MKKKAASNKTDEKRCDELIDLMFTPEFQFFLSSIQRNDPDKKQRKRDMMVISDAISDALNKKKTTSAVRTHVLAMHLFGLLSTTDADLGDKLLVIKKYINDASSMRRPRDDTDVMVR